MPGWLAGNIEWNLRSLDWAVVDQTRLQFEALIQRPDKDTSDFERDAFARAEDFEFHAQ